jgi:hypothetical protein
MSKHSSMMKKGVTMKRREFLKKAVLSFGAVVVGGKEVSAQDIKKDHPMPGMVHGGAEMKHEQMFIHEPTGWADPNIKISPPPLSMGKQMDGFIHRMYLPRL